jgi:hypothetical protein
VKSWYEDSARREEASEECKVVLMRAFGLTEALLCMSSYAIPAVEAWETASTSVGLWQLVFVACPFSQTSWLQSGFMNQTWYQAFFVL